jgi:hypothetical protein
LRDGQAPDQIEKAEDAKDTKTVAALLAKSDALGQQIGPEYLRLLMGFQEVDPQSAEGGSFAALFNALHDKCK